MRGKVPFCSTNKHPWLLLTVCWQCAQPLEILIATYRHALFLERSDEVSLDVQLWTCANSLRIYATAWLTSMVRSFPVLWNKERCRWASTTWTCLLSHSCTFTFHWTHPYLLVLSFVWCTSSLSHLALSRSRFSLVGTYIFEAGFAELLKSERTSLCHRSRHVP